MTYPKQKYNKLVRDKILEHLESLGGTPRSHIADDAEYWAKLKEKLLEEVGEFLADESMGEIADIQEVLAAICEYKKFDPEELQKVRDKKADEKGRFEKRIILDES